VANPELPEERQRQALFFLVHFVGDMHQPLHCGDLKDFGGNKRIVRFGIDDDDAHEEAKLHGFWDTQLVRLAVQGLDAEDGARRLNDLLTPDKIENFQKGDVKDWIKESKELAKEHAYGRAGIQGQDGIAPNPPIRLSAEYIANGRRVVTLQLQRAGVRLAKLLNEVFEED
jgi:hypothetical protein